MRHIALEGRCFVLTACQVVKRRDYPNDYRCSISNDPDALIMRGGSAIVDPLGKVLVGPAFNEEVLLTAELDLEAIPRQVRFRCRWALCAAGCFLADDQ